MTTAIDTIEITLNGAPRRIAAGRTVAGLLDELGVHPRMVVVEHNREILDRSAYGTSPIREGDTLELVHFVGGG